VLLQLLLGVLELPQRLLLRRELLVRRAQQPLLLLVLPVLRRLLLRVLQLRLLRVLRRRVPLRDLRGLGGERGRGASGSGVVTAKGASVCRV